VQGWVLIILMGAPCVLLIVCICALVQSGSSLRTPFTGLTAATSHTRRLSASTVEDTVSPMPSKSAWVKAAKGLTLVIVESPAKAKTIQSFLDPDRFIVDYSAGHIRDLPSTTKGVLGEYKKKLVLPSIRLSVAELGIDVFNNFEPIYVPLPGQS
jgi:Toprim domain